ncbi:MAG: hypothetical protein FJX57_20275, partial [Alphaproteobacteria bacterium]|nr:hypothetical protein [Alphaproteobacteria bacterium]
AIAGDGSVRLSIADTGIGIPASEIGRVTEPFHRAANALEASEGGTGLGLAITRSLVELHGGRLDLDSHVGEGTVATVVLPPHRIASTRTGLEAPVERRKLMTAHAD